MSRSGSWLLALSLLVPGITVGQEKNDIKELKLRDWQPRSMLVTKATEVPKPAFPVIDVHNHLGGGKATLTPERVKRYLAEMDAAGVRTVVNLDGGWGPRLKETLAALDKAHPGRFLTYALIDFDGIDEPGWSDREADAAGRELRGRRQGPEVPQDARPGRPLQGRPPRAGRRPEARPDLGGLCRDTSGPSRSTPATPARSSRRWIASTSAGTS